MGTFVKPILLGCAGPVLTAEEAAFFRAANPFGFVLFARNCEYPSQVRALTASLRESVGRADAPIFIDQEGGRVTRLKPPHWPALPAAGEMGALYGRDPALGLAKARLVAAQISAMLRDVGIDGNFAPLLDLDVPGASSVMGDRTFAGDLETVVALGRRVMETYLEGGIYPVVKHMPGHGRVKVDPHETLPFVDADMASLRAQEFAPFKALRDAPCAMNCHVVFRAIDADQPVSLSRKAHDEVLRGEIGFEGMIFSDDLGMKALSLPLRERGVRALDAGADVVLYCPGVLEDSREMCADLPEMDTPAWDRWARARTLRAARSLGGETETDAVLQYA